MFSQTAEYALRAMVHLAYCGDTPVNSENIAEATHVPPGYLSKVMRDLVVAKIVTSQRGPNGGFTLLRQPDEVTILDVINAVDPVRRITECPLGNPAHVKLCPLHQRLDDAIATIEESFRRTTIAEVLESNRMRGRCATLTRGDKPVPLRKSARNGE